MPIAGSEEWYTRRDGRRNFTPHCPLAASDKCPRYYLSMKHATHADALAYSVSEATRGEIEKRWEASEVLALADNSVGTWFGHDGSLRGIEGFCPEVAAKIFGYYCSELRGFVDDDARDAQRQALIAEKTARDDPRRQWAIFRPKHYSECLEFSVYSGGEQNKSGKKSGRGSKAVPNKRRFDVFKRDNFKCVYCGRGRPEVVLQVDHKISVADNGSNELENLVTACEACNNGKGRRSVRETFESSEPDRPSAS